eukprot:11466945-Heterocapsa_arctica.AAC.1
MGLSCWQGDPPTTRSMAPGSILERMAWSLVPFSPRRFQTSAHACSKKGAPCACLLAQMRPVGLERSPSVSQNHPPANLP